MAAMKTIAMILDEAHTRRHEYGALEWVAIEAYKAGRKSGINHGRSLGLIQCEDEQRQLKEDESMRIPTDDMSNIARPTRRTPEEVAAQRKFDAIEYVRASIRYNEAQRDMSKALEKLYFPTGGKRMVVEVDGKHYAISQVDEVWSCNEVEVL